MLHQGTLVVGPFVATGKPYRISCSCGTEGDFNMEEQAMGYWYLHLSHLGVTDTWELDVPGAGKKVTGP